MTMTDDLAKPADADIRVKDPIHAPGAVMPALHECALLLDIDGTLLDMAPTPREVWVPPELAIALGRLLQLTNGAMALVSGRSRPTRIRAPPGHLRPRTRISPPSSTR